jgi:molybdate transport system permease protein
VKHPWFRQSAAATPETGLHGRLFAAATLSFVGLFVAAFLALFAADASYVNAAAVDQVLHSEEIRHALWLSLWTSGLTVIIGLLFAIPMGYALSRYRFPGHALVDSIVDLPIILPPLVLGLSLLVFFRTDAGRAIQSTGWKFVLEQKGIVLCQFLVSASFGIRAVKLTFDGIHPRIEHVAMTLGCTRTGAFFRVALPMAWRGIIVGGILIWTRAFGLFGPLQVLVGAVPNRTEVLPTTMYLEQSVGHLEVALAVALLMLALATVALVIVRTVGLRQR